MTELKLDYRLGKVIRSAHKTKRKKEMESLENDHNLSANQEKQITLIINVKRQKQLEETSVYTSLTADILNRQSRKATGATLSMMDSFHLAVAVTWHWQSWKRDIANVVHYMFAKLNPSQKVNLTAI